MRQTATHSQANILEKKYLHDSYDARLGGHRKLAAKEKEKYLQSTIFSRSFRNNLKNNPETYSSLNSFFRIAMLSQKWI